MDTVGILSILEGEPYEKVRKLWKHFEDKYNSIGVQSFDHPNLTFQAGRTEKLQELSTDFQKMASGVKPFEIQVNGLGHFGKNVIYLKVKKSKDLVRINELTNKFLEKLCAKLFEPYCPENWVPHITLSMNDLTERTFGEAWNALEETDIGFKQRIHNIYLVKQDSESKISLVRKCEL